MLLWLSALIKPWTPKQEGPSSNPLGLAAVPSGKAFIIVPMQCSERTLKASFNNVFTFKNLSNVSLHAISVFDKDWCKNEALKKIAPQKHH